VVLGLIAACLACGGQTRDTLHTGLRDRVFRCAPGAWTLQHCRGCGSAYLDPRPNEASIGRAYETYYTHRQAVAPPPDGLRKRSKPWRLALRNGYLNARYNYDFQPALALPGGGDLLSARRRCEADRWIRHLRRPATPERPRLLDIGCGGGAFVAQMRGAGWAAEGLEVNAHSARLAREAGIPVHEGPLRASTYPEHHFDAVTLSHVAEHLHDPRGVLATCRRILRPGGALWIATPNLLAIGHARFGADWLGLDPPRHLVLFTPASLRDLLEEVGFTEVSGPLPNWSARWSFRSSAAIAAGVEPLDSRAVRSGLPRALLRRLTLAAWLANRRALRRPELTEEIIVLAS